MRNTTRLIEIFIMEKKKTTLLLLLCIL